MTEYRWAFDVRDVLASISVHGPVVIGVDWYAGMEDVDEDGYIHPTGEIMGGHCVCLIGVEANPADPFGWSVIGHNSWGESWGIKGSFKLAAGDLRTLLNNHGDACVPVVRVPSPTPAPARETVPMPPRVELHPSTLQLLELFEYQHLPTHLQAISKKFYDLAWDMAQEPTQRGAEQTTCLRKLLEAKDCAVRMAVPLGQIGNNSPPLFNNP